MDVAQKKQEVLERIAEAPAGIVFARIDILNEVQLADLLKASFVPYLRHDCISSRMKRKDGAHPTQKKYYGTRCRLQQQNKEPLCRIS